MKEKIVLLIVGILMITVLTMAELTMSELMTAVPMIKVLLILIFIIMEKMTFKAGESLMSTIKIVDIELAKDEFGISNGKININFVGELPSLNFDKAEVIVKEGFIQINQAMFERWLSAIEDDNFFQLDYLLSDVSSNKRLSSLAKALKGSTLTIENVILDCTRDNATNPLFMQRVLHKANLNDKLIKICIRAELARQSQN